MIKATRRHIGVKEFQQPFPLDYWILKNNKLFTLYSDIIKNKKASMYNYLDFAFCNKLLDDFVVGKSTNSRKIDQIITFQLFLNQIK